MRLPRLAQADALIENAHCDVSLAARYAGGLKYESDMPPSPIVQSSITFSLRTT